MWGSLVLEEGPNVDAIERKSFNNSKGLQGCGFGSSQLNTENGMSRNPCSRTAELEVAFPSILHLSYALAFSDQGLEGDRECRDLFRHAVSLVSNTVAMRTAIRKFSSRISSSSEPETQI